MTRSIFPCILLGLILGCSREPGIVPMGDVDQRVFIPIFEVQRIDGGSPGSVRLPFVAQRERERCRFALAIQLPDSLRGWATYLAVSVDDYATVSVGDSALQTVQNVGEVYLGDWRGETPIPVNLVCWARAEPTRLRGLTVLARPPRHHSLRKGEARLAHLRAIHLLPYTGWQWTQDNTSGGGWEEASPGTTWEGEGSVAWFRTQIRKPKSFNGFATDGDSLWLRLSVDDSAVVFIGDRPAGQFRGMGTVTLPSTWQQGEPVEVRMKIINFGGPGRFVGAWLVSSRLSELVSPIVEVLKDLRDARMLLEQHPSPRPEWEATYFSAIRTLADLLGSKSKSIEEATERLDQASQVLGSLRRALSQYPPFVCGPYLQDVGTDHITVMWETLVACKGVVHFRPSGVPGGEWRHISEETPRCIHEIRINGLEPDTEYEYWVQARRAGSPSNTFRTAPRGRRAFRLAVWGDSRSDPYAHETVASQMERYRPDLAVNVGDVVGHGANLPEWVEMHWKPIRRLAAATPTYIAIGNHEYGGFWHLGRVPPFEQYVSQPGNEYYFAFTYGGSRLIILDSNREDDGIPLGREQFNWLKRELASDSCQSADWRFVFFHHPPYSEAWDWGGYYDGEKSFREKLVPLFEKHNVTFVFSGHTHDYERGQWPKGSGPYYVITGGGGAELDNLIYKDWPQIDVQAFEYHFCLLDVEPTKVRFRAIRHDGSVLDEFAVVK